MKPALRVEEIARALLYEGYLLYPYRPSALKNQHRWNFGVLYPESSSSAIAGAEPNKMEIECLLLPGAQPAIGVSVRFLHLAVKQSADTEDQQGAWQEALEREVTCLGLDLERLTAGLVEIPFVFDPNRSAQKFPQARDGFILRQEIVRGLVSVAAERVRGELCKLCVQIRNMTHFESAAGLERSLALMQSLVSTHVILQVTNGEFVSLLDPPEIYREAAAACRNIGVWPVLAGAEGERNCMLASPIILYDYPQIAPESPGDLFDGTEIDELLTLRILTLTEEEKREMRGGDSRAREILARSETLPVEQLLKMHGAVRGLHAIKGER